MGEYTEIKITDELLEMVQVAAEYAGVPGIIARDIKFQHADDEGTILFITWNLPRRMNHFSVKQTAVCPQALYSEIKRHFIKAVYKQWRLTPPKALSDEGKALYGDQFDVEDYVISQYSESIGIKVEYL